jgi:DNA-binding transcriptional LysR family regulator
LILIRSREKVAQLRTGPNLPYAVYAPRRGNANRLPWITYEEGMASLPHVAWIDRAIKQEGSRPALVVNDSETALDAIKQGYGKSLLPCLVADREPGLKRSSGAKPVLEREFWLLVNPSLRHLARIEAVVTWIDDLIATARNCTAV